MFWFHLLWLICLFCFALFCFVLLCLTYFINFLCFFLIWFSYFDFIFRVGQQTVLTLKIKNSEILSSPFTISRVKYGNERIDEYTLKHGNDYLEESEKLILADLSSEKSTGLPDEVTDFAEIDKFLSGNFMDGKKYCKLKNSFFAESRKKLICHQYYSLVYYILIIQ